MRTSFEWMPSRVSCGPISCSGSTRFAHGKPEEWLPAREVAGFGDACGLAGVDDDHPVWVLDRVGEDRERLRPLSVEERVQ